MKKVKNYIVYNDVHVVDMSRLSTDNRYVHSFNVVIYRKHTEKVIENDIWLEDVYKKYDILIIILNVLIPFMIFYVH